MCVTCVYTCTHSYVLGYVCSCRVARVEDRSQSLVLTSTLSETVALVFHCCIHQASQELSWLHLPTCYRSTVIIDTCYHIQVGMSSKGSKLRDPNAYTINTSLTE